MIRPCQTGRIRVDGVDVERGTARHHTIKSYVIIGIGHQTTRSRSNSNEQQHGNKG